MSTITRRGFVGGTAGVIGTVAAGTLLAQSQALANEDTDTLEPVVSKEDDWLGEPPEIDEEELTETVEVEIVIVGAGNGGCMCACRAAENGADVVVLEKQAASFNSRNFIGGVGTRWQESSGHAIDRNDIVCELVRYSSGWANQKLINRWADNSADMLDYYDAILEEAGEGIMLEYGTPEGTRYTGWPTNHFPCRTATKPMGS